MASESENREPHSLASLRVPSPPTSAPLTRSGSRSPSYSTASGKCLSFKGHRINVILPETLPELDDFDADILERIAGIQDFDQEDVIPPEFARQR